MASSFHRSPNTIPSPLPDDYVRQANFTQYEVNHPGQAPRGTDLDSEFNKVGYALAETQDRLGLIQRPDGNLVNGIVLPESLSTAAKTITTGVWNPRGSWVAGTAYAKRDLVVANGVSYVCTTDHVASNLFSTDQAAGYWIPVSVAASLVASAQNYANQAGASAQTASNAASNATQSATTATTRANTAAQSATNAANSATAAANSATSAAGSQSTAANSATAAANSASSAANSAANASTYANNASSSATSAAASVRQLTSGALDTRYSLSGADGLGLNTLIPNGNLNLTQADSGKTVFPLPSTTASMYLPSNPAVGTNFTIWANGNYTVRVNRTGSPTILFPGQTSTNSFAFPTNWNIGATFIFQGSNWLAIQFGRPRIADGQLANEAVNVRQLNAAINSVNLFSSFYNRTSYRASGTTYTNTTGKPMAVYIMTNSNSNSDIQAYINGALILQPRSGGGTYGAPSTTMIVPSGMTYRAVVTNLSTWFESY